MLYISHQNVQLQLKAILNSKKNLGVIFGTYLIKAGVPQECPFVKLGYNIFSGTTCLLKSIIFYKQNADQTVQTLSVSIFKTNNYP